MSDKERLPKSSEKPNAKFGLLLLLLVLASGSAIGYILGRSSVTPVVFKYAPPNTGSEKAVVVPTAQKHDRGVESTHIISEPTPAPIEKTLLPEDAEIAREVVLPSPPPP